jgi:hypothetical protein
MMTTKLLLRAGALAYPALLCATLVALAQPQRAEQTPSKDPDGEKLNAEEWASFQKTVQPFLVKHCYSCHGPKNDDSEVRFDQLSNAAALAKGLLTLEKAQEMLRNRKMPPAKRPQPAAEEVQPVIAWLEGHSARVIDCQAPRNPGHVTLRRLNRAEYNNTIRDLLAVEFRPADGFPVDDAGYGFDNIGDVLSLSPLLLEKYLTAAESILEKAIFVEPAVAAPVKRWDALKADGTVPPPPALPEGKQGKGGFRQPPTRVFSYKSELYTEYEFPKDGEYAFRVRAFSKAGADKQRPKMAFSVDGQQLPTFAIGVDFQDASELGIKARVAAGRHKITLAMINGDEPPPPAEKKAAAEPEKKSTGEPEKKAGADLEKKAGGQPEKKVAAKGPTANVFYIEVEGPLDRTPERMPESFKRVFAAVPSAQLTKEKAAEKVIRQFAGRAYRRPVRDGEVARLMKLWNAADRDGEPFERSIYLTLQAVLVSPHFLFRVETAPQAAAAKEGGVENLNEYALASRLSYFLWSSMPDEELFALAAKGQLREMLDEQVRRMLKDAKSAALVENFAGQWLQLRMLQIAAPDPKRFPDWDEPLREAMIKETELFFTAIVQENRSLMDFVDAKFTFVNERLAKHYGLKDVRGEQFRRIELAGVQRGGLLSQASILTITSHPHRTSPVLRGKWVLENLLDAPPPPPPPDVPQLAEGDQAELKGTLKQRLEQHRANPACASCHDRLDPIGFGLENYDAIGAWRTKEGENPIDSTGTLPGGHQINGPGDLKKYLTQRPDVFCRCVAEKMLTYALGRGLEPYDRCAVDDVMTALRRNNYRFSTLVTAIAHTDAFQKHQGKKR